MFSQTLLVIIVLTIAHLATHGVRADCYSRDGILAKDSAIYTGPELQPCGRNTNTCCLPNEKCGTNLLCAGKTSLARQYCSNKDWQGCSELSPETKDHGLAIQDCGGNIVCYKNSTCCKDGPNFFVNPFTGEVKDSSLRDTTASPTYWEVVSTSSVISSSTALSSSSTSSTTTSAASSSAPSDTTTPTSHSGLSSGASAGIGVGAGAAVAGLAFLGWLFLRRRKRTRALPSQIEQHDIALAHPYQDRKDGPYNSGYHEAPPPPPLELDQGRPRHEMY